MKNSLKLILGVSLCSASLLINPTNHNVIAETVKTNDSQQNIDDTLESNTDITVDSAQIKDSSTADADLSEQKEEEISDIAPRATTRSVSDDLIASLKEGWSNIPLGSNNGVILNPINQSKIGFSKRGINNNMPSIYSLLSFYVEDPFGESYIYGHRKVTFIPFVNDTQIYWTTSNTGSGIRNGGIGYDNEVDSKYNYLFSETYFLKKDNQLRQIMKDSKNEIVYVLTVSLLENNNFSSQFQMYNCSSKNKKFALLEMADTFYYDDYVPIYTLANNSGFYLKPDDDMKFEIKIKNKDNEFIGDYRRMAPGIYTSASYKNNYGNYAPSYLERVNAFESKFNKNGIEQYNYPADVVITQGADSAYQLGTDAVNVPPGGYINGATELFVGLTVNEMVLESTPTELNVYEDYDKDTKFNYTLSNISRRALHGVIVTTYPNNEKVEENYVSKLDKNKGEDITGQVDVLRTTLPDILNDEPGTIKTYPTKLGAKSIKTTPTEVADIPSNDLDFNINVFKLGATPVNQVVQKGDKLDRKSDKFLKNPIILPGHNANYTFLDDPVDTSSVGLKYDSIRMTDINQQEKTQDIKVPISVVDGEIPENGLVLYSNNFQTKKETFAFKTSAEIDADILKLSKTQSWDANIGSDENVNIEVESKTLPLNPDYGTYEAVIKSTRDSDVVYKKITIEISDVQDVQVQFVDEDNENIIEPVIITGKVGEKIDLTENKELQSKIQQIIDKNYELDETPENEKDLEIQPQETTVQYKFKGILFVKSSPLYMNFGRSFLSKPFIKVENAIYDQPLVVWDNRKNAGEWKLTATLKQQLTSQDFPEEVLPSAIRYKKNEKESVILSKDVSEPIAIVSPSEHDETNISEDWDNNKSGLFLEVASGEVLKSGKYKAKILWQVEQTP